MKDELKKDIEWRTKNRYRTIIPKGCSNCAYMENRNRIDEPTHLFCLKMKEEMSVPDWFVTVGQYNVCDRWRKK